MTLIVSRGGSANSVTGGEVMTLAKSIQTGEYERLGILLDHERVVVYEHRHVFTPLNRTKKGPEDPGLHSFLD